MKILNKHHRFFRVFLFLFSMLPFCVLMYWSYNDELGINPFETLMNVSGLWAIIFLILTLMITPLRRWLTWFSKVFCLGYGKRLADWNYLIRSRRMLGLWSFFYASIHTLVYLHFEVLWSWEDFVFDFTERIFINFGVVSWFILFVLSVTSPMSVRKKMGKNWRRVHRMMYPLAIIAVMHIYLESKALENQAYVYALLVLILLMHRIIVVAFTKFQRKDDSGLVVNR